MEESPASPGYEPYLVQRLKADPLVARGMARLLVRHGNRVADERRRQSEAVRVIRFLAKPGRRSKAFDRNVAALLRVAKETTAIQTLFVSVGLDEVEFVDALKRVADGDLATRNRVAEIAATIAPIMVVARGRPASAASAAHKFLIESLSESDLGRKTRLGYSYSDAKEDFTDSLTQATRREFGDYDFDPRPVCRRIRTSRKLTT